MMFRPKTSSSLVIITLAITLGLTSCSQGTSSEKSFDRVGSTEEVQDALRNRAYSLWDARYPSGDVNAEINVSVDPIPNSAELPAPAESSRVVSVAEERAWRAEQAALLEDTPTEKLGIMCQLFFEEFISPSSNNSIGSQFLKIRAEIESQGLSPYAVDQVELHQDNRLTMPYPREGKPSFMVTCKGDVLLKKNSGGFEKARAFISWAYVLKNGKAEFSFPWLSWNILE